jgi:hypothetical protein
MCRGFVESQIPEHLHLRVNYLTACRAKTKLEAEALPRWTTVAVLYDADGNEVVRGVSKCGPNDNPNRKIGRAIAVGRALRKYHENTQTL